jgi:putative toxin-antitoxin system antitoxin component (TIGR02293 family)
LSERTIQRYKVENRTFDPLQSEKIIEIALFYNKGVEVFGTSVQFNSWLETNNLALGNIKPKMLLDNTFGISMLKDELIRIEHGVLA